jgi:hypothetical protein
MFFVLLSKLDALGALQRQRLAKEVSIVCQTLIA